MRTHIPAALCIVFLSSSVPVASDLILGAVEDVPGSYVGEANVRAVRVLFRKAGADWLPYKNDCSDQNCLKSAPSEYPQEVSWTIAFDGKNLGQVTARTPQAFSRYWRIGQQEITSTGAVATVGTRSLEFSGFLETQIYRPLVAVSQPNFKDPDGWKPVVLTATMLADLRREFRRKYPRLCQADPADETRLLPFAYEDTDIKPVKSYAAKTGWSLAHLHIEATDCNDSEAGSGLADPWFAGSPDGSIHYLDSGLLLVDAGDYDNDGKSELLFSVAGYNLGGYRLYYNNFSRHADFTFHYH